MVVISGRSSTARCVSVVEGVAVRLSVRYAPTALNALRPNGPEAAATVLAPGVWGTVATQCADPHSGRVVERRHHRGVEQVGLGVTSQRPGGVLSVLPVPRRTPYGLLRVERPAAVTDDELDILRLAVVAARDVAGRGVRVVPLGDVLERATAASWSLRAVPASAPVAAAPVRVMSAVFGAGRGHDEQQVRHRPHRRRSRPAADLGVEDRSRRTRRGSRCSPWPVYEGRVGTSRPPIAAAGTASMAIAMPVMTSFLMYVSFLRLVPVE